MSGSKKKQSAQKSRVELRLHPKIASGLKEIAAEADISVNQLVEGICAWAVEHAHVGMPGPSGWDDENECYLDIDTLIEPGCVWFGWEGVTQLDPEMKKPVIAERGMKVFSLNFNASRAVEGRWDDFGKEVQDGK